MGWALAILAAITLGGYFGLQYALARNGPAVLDTLDRITGGKRGAHMLKRQSLGSDKAQKLVVYGPAEKGPSEKRLGEKGAQRPVLVFIHGGSWRNGDPDDYGFVARTFVREGFVVVLAGYRLGDAGKFPAMLEDTASSIAWTKANIAQYGGDPDAIFVAGHSAGAYNAVMAVLDPQWLGDAGVAGVIGLAGPYDFYPFDSDSTRAAFGDTPDPAATTQPIAFVRGDAPPMLLMTGEKDTVVKPRNSKVLAERLNAAGARAELRLFGDMDHYDILVKTASPWNDRRVVDAIRDFALPIADARHARTTTSVPVQGKTR